MNDAVTMTIRTNRATKDLIQAAADRIGISLNAFATMILKQAAKQDKIIIDNTADNDRVFPMTQRDWDNATRIKTDPNGGGLLIEKNDDPALVDWAVNG
jgi:uncharacterized protein (DUF1778 family)